MKKVKYRSHNIKNHPGNSPQIKTWNRKSFIRFVTISIGAFLLPSINSLLSGKNKAEQPNILWITSEDNGPFLGCYGDKFANTPVLDKMASEGVLYENAFANVPVCAPARSTILTGMYACSMGTHNMRSRYSIPKFIKPYPVYLREAGYYCTNNSKTDYNINMKDKNVWDECSKKAHYKNRKNGRPFFSIFNLTTTHESSIFNKGKKRRDHDPAKVTLPPYHPDTPEMRSDWAYYYDNVTRLDKQIGGLINDLEKSGLAEDTIVFYYADHGGVLGRSKRYIYDSGTHVPFIIRFPKKYQHLAPGKPGMRTDRIVSFVDLAPTLFSLANIKVPDYMQGKAFLGKQQKKPGEYACLFRQRMDERMDMMRALRDKKYRYIRNYMPHKKYGQYLVYLWKAVSMQSWEKAFKEGKCNKTESIFWGTKPAEELYDISADPHEVNNLASDKKYSKILARMQEAMKKWMLEIRDTGFIPEGEMIERSKNKTAYEVMREEGMPLERIISTAELSSEGKPENLKELIKRLEDKESAVRYWAATGCVILKDKAGPALPALKKALDDSSGDVRIAAAEAVCNLGQVEKGLRVLITELKNDNEMITLHALNVLTELGEKAMPALDAIVELREQKGGKKYNGRLTDHLIFLLTGVKPKEEPKKKKKK